MDTDPSPAKAGTRQFFDALVAGDLSLGQTITQSELCKVLGISLSTLREVSVLLEAEGLIEVKKRMGVRLFYPDVAFVRNTFQYRELLECEGLHRLGSQPTEDWVSEMSELHADTQTFVRETATPEDYRLRLKELEARFHGSFIAAFGNDQIEMNYDRTMQKMYLFRLLSPKSVNQTNTLAAIQEHCRVIDHVATGNIDAAVEALRVHFSGVLRRTLTG